MIDKFWNSVPAQIVAVVIVVSLVVSFMWFVIQPNRASDQLKTACRGDSPSWISEIRGVYYYRCRDGSTGYIER